jgi:transcriptional pleiotropic regulator of transition state genes
MNAIRMDQLGRIVLPSELRHLLRLQDRDELEISVEGECIILQKRQDVRFFCSGDNPEVEFKDRRICKACASELVQQNPRRLQSPTGGSTSFG